MGQQQLLLIILGVIIVGVAIAVGVMMFSSQSIASNKDAIINDFSTLTSDIYAYKIRPASMGGGNGSYEGYTINANGPWGTENPNAMYFVKPTDYFLEIVAISKKVTDSEAIATFDFNGNPYSAPIFIGFGESLTAEVSVVSN